MYQCLVSLRLQWFINSIMSLGVLVVAPEGDVEGLDRFGCEGGADGFMIWLWLVFDPGRGDIVVRKVEFNCDQKL
jgi:hypothetical protein